MGRRYSDRRLGRPGAAGRALRVSGQALVRRHYRDGPASRYAGTGTRSGAAAATAGKLEATRSGARQTAGRVSSATKRMSTWDARVKVITTTI